MRPKRWSARGVASWARRRPRRVIAFVVALVLTSVGWAGVAFAAPTAPGAPTITLLSGRADTSGHGAIGVNWAAPSSDGGSAVVSYTATASPGGASCTVTSGPLFCYIEGLTVGETYAVTVTATNAVGTGPSSASVSQVAAYSPAPPTQIAAAPGDGAITVSWAPPVAVGEIPADGGSPITSYLAGAEPASGSGTGVSTCTTTGALSCTITGLRNGTAYVVKVHALNAVGLGATGSAAQAITPVGPPSQPTVSALILSTTSLRIVWPAVANDGGSPVTSYAATLSPGGASCTTDAAARSCDLSGLTAGTTYTVSLTATNGLGTSAPGTATQLLALRPTVPLNVVAVPANRSVLISWAAPADDGGLPITSYVVGQVAGRGATTVCTTTALSCLVTGLTNGTSYTFRIRAENGVVAGSPAIVTTSAVTPQPVPDAPTDVSAAPAGDGAVNVSWTAPASNGSAITGYTVTSTPGGLTCTTTTTTCEVTGLSNGRSYTFTVSATNSSGVGPSSARSGAVTPMGLVSVTPGSQSVGFRCQGGTGRLSGPFTLGVTAVPAGTASLAITAGSAPGHVDTVPTSGPITITVPAGASFGCGEAAGNTLPWSVTALDSSGTALGSRAGTFGLTYVD